MLSYYRFIISIDKIIICLGLSFCIYISTIHGNITAQHRMSCSNADAISLIRIDQWHTTVERCVWPYDLKVPGCLPGYLWRKSFLLLAIENRSQVLEIPSNLPGNLRIFPPAVSVPVCQKMSWAPVFFANPYYKPVCSKLHRILSCPWRSSLTPVSGSLSQ